VSKCRTGDDRQVHAEPSQVPVIVVRPTGESRVILVRRLIREGLLEFVG
jgi:hypothetical protein